MSRQEATYNVPEIFDFNGLCKYLAIAPFQHKDVHFEKIEDKDDVVNTSAKPFKYYFYAISLVLNGQGTFNSGFWKSIAKKNIIYSQSNIKCHVFSLVKKMPTDNMLS